MKKKIVVLLCCMLLAAGCGNNEEAPTEVNTEAAENSEEQTTETQEAENNSTGVVSTDIEYDVNDHVTLGDYMNVEVSINPADYVVDENAITVYANEMIAYYEPFMEDTTKKVVEKGDIVKVDYVGKKDGVAFDGGSAEGTYIDTQANADATSGGGFIDGFSDGLIGASVEDTVDSQVTFPDDYGSEELSGQTVTFTFTIHSINTKWTVDNIDDEYVNRNFQVESVDLYMEDVKGYLTEQAAWQKESDIRNAVIDAVIEKCTVDSIPEGLVEARTEEYINGFEAMYCTDGTSLEDFLMANYYTTEEDFRAQTTELMEQNVEQELIFEAIVEAEKIEFNQEEFDTYMDNLVANGGFTSKEEVYSTYGPNAEDGEKYLKNIYLQNEACTRITEKAVINEVEGEE